MNYNKGAGTWSGSFKTFFASQVWKRRRFSNASLFFRLLKRCCYK